MALYKGSKKYTVSTPGAVLPLEVTKNGTYTPTNGAIGFNPVVMNNTMPINNMGNHCDKDGIWHKPVDWDDIESIDLTDKHEVYFLCGCHITEHDWFRIRFYGTGTLSWSYGHVSNGTYTLHQSSTETTVSSGAYISLFLANFQDDYIVVRIKSTTGITSCSYQAWAATAELNYAMTFRAQSVLMRYGRMTNGNTLANSATYFLESDNIIDFAKNYQNTTTTITVNSAYNTAPNLQRWRCDGWDLAKNKITNFSSMFDNCWCLCDTPDTLNLDGWVTSNVTTTASMFNQCQALRCNISVKNWVLTNVTTMASTFNNCIGIKSILGTETWGSAPKCTTTANLFYACQSVKGTIDVSGCYFGNGTANFTTCANMFATCRAITKLNISNMNLSKCTTVSYMLNGMQSLKELVINNFTPISATCTNTSYFCGYNGIEELTLTNWNFSGNRANFLTFGFQYSMGLKKLVFSSCTAPTGVTIADSTNGCCFCRYAYNLRYLDVRFLDMSVFSSTHTHTDSFRDLFSLVDFYPPQNISKSFNLTNNFQLSHDSLLRIINNLVTLAEGTTATLTIGAYNIWKLSAAEQAVATNKGWTLA